MQDRSPVAILTDIDKAALAAAEKAGIASPSLISRTDTPTLETLAFENECLEARVRLLEGVVARICGKYHRDI